MFTGLITEVGSVKEIIKLPDALRITFNAQKSLYQVTMGASISVNGCCLTVIDYSDTEFTADVMMQSLNQTTLGKLSKKDKVNLETAAKLGDHLGGHIVQGHVDSKAKVIDIIKSENWNKVRFEINDYVAKHLIMQGSVTINGVSLTVSNLSEEKANKHFFEVSLIPETLQQTTLGLLKVNDEVNIETDMLARHIIRASKF